MIESPDLEIRNEARLSAEGIAHVSGGLTETIVAAQIETRRELLKLITAGLDEPVCPELTNANPSAPHTVLLEAMGWTLAQQAYRFNRVPLQNFIAFTNLFGIEPRPATAAETILRFEIDPPVNTAVTIPLGTQVSTEDGVYVFETTEALVIPYANVDDLHDVKARRTVAGHTLLQGDLLTSLIDPVAFVETVTNPSAIDSGTALESLESTLDRVRRYQKRGERIVSTKDLEEAIGEEALEGNGVVRAFPFVKNGNFGPNVAKLVGHTTVIVMTKTGDNVDSIALQKIGALLDTAIGNQFIYVVDPEFVEFNVDVTIKLNTGSPQGAVLAAVEKNLRNFYAASRQQFGRPILRSEIIAVIEGTGGVDRIVVVPPISPGASVADKITQNTPILAAPLADTFLREYELAKLDTVEINVV